MGLLDELLAGAMQGAAGASPRERKTSAAGGADMGRVMMALLPVVLAMLSGGQGGRSRGGGLDDLLGQMMGGGAPRAGAGGGLGDLLGQVLGGGAGGGGLGDLLGELQRAGFGEQARSWVGTGANQPIPPDAIESIFGRGGLESIARQAGLSEADASRGLAALLPEVVDRVTPGGEVPDFDQLTASVESLARQLRG